MGFDAEFPAIRSAAERLRASDVSCRTMVRDVGAALDDAAAASAARPLDSAISALSDALETAATKAADQVRELWQAVDKSAAQYDATEHATTGDITAVRFGGHDGHQ